MSNFISDVLDVDVLKTTPSGPVEGFALTIGQSNVAPFKASRWRLDPDLWTNWDQHGVIELWLIATGSGVVWRDDVATRVAAGDAVLMPSQVRHRLRNDGSTTIEVFSVWWNLDALGSAGA